MKSHAVRLSAPLLLACMGGTLVLLATLPLRSAANILPESALMIHVQPVSGSCETPITLCDEIVNTSRASGPQEFLIFFEPIAWQQSGDPVTLGGLHTELTWPDAWELIEFDPCGGEGELSGAGPPYALDMSWYYPSLPMGFHEVFLVARLVLDVDGEGWLGFPPGYLSPIELAGIITLAHGSPAEAGVECGFTRYDCGHGPLCELVFADTELHLRAPLGGAAEGETLLREIGHCQVEVDPGAAWLRVKVVPIPWDQNRIELSADAAGLALGTYETWVQASGWDWCTDCLKVLLTVEDLTSTREATWSAIKAQYR
jgi:hypothetical protein